MPRLCTVCHHPERRAIDEALAVGAANRHLAAEYGLTEVAVRRHRAAHLPALLDRAHEASEVDRGADVLDKVRALAERATTILDEAEAAGDLRTALAAIREARGCFELIARVTGDIEPDHVDVRVAVIGQAVAEDPEMRRLLDAARTRLGDRLAGDVRDGDEPRRLAYRAAPAPAR